MERYKILGHISAGAHGVILKSTYAKGDQSAGRYGKNSKNDKIGDQLAVKRIFIRKSKDIPLSLVREIKSLQLLNGENFIISLLDVFAHGSSVNLVFPLLPTNLTALIYEYNISRDQKIAYAYMLLQGIRYCHANGIVHRDLKPSNILIGWDGVLKICDFGQARVIPTDDGSKESDVFLSHQVCTRWYRAPELLYGSNHYGFAVDMWSAGCIIGELNQQWPMFKGESDIEQLCIVVNSLGNPPEDWAQEMPDFNKIIFNVNPVNDSQEDLTNSNDWISRLSKSSGDNQVVDLVKKLLRYTQRLSASDALEHSYFEKIIKDGFNRSTLIMPTTVKHLGGPPDTLISRP